MLFKQIDIQAAINEDKVWSLNSSFLSSYLIKISLRHDIRMDMMKYNTRRQTNNLRHLVIIQFVIYTTTTKKSQNIHDRLLSWLGTYTSINK
jgi:hypothetical protein